MSNFLTSAFDAAEADLIGTAGVNIATTGLQSGRSSDNTTGITLSPISQWMKVTLSLASAAFAANAYAALYLIPQNTDGSTWPDYTSGNNQASPTIPGQYLKGIFQFNNATRAQAQTISFYIGDMANATFRPVIVNNCGVAWATTGNTLKYRTFSDEYTA